MNGKTIPSLRPANHLPSLIEAWRNPSAFLLKLSCTAGDIGEFKAGPVRIICVNRPEWVHAILCEQAGAFQKMPAVKALRAFTGDGLLISDGATWNKHRRLAAPAFHRQRIVAYQAIAAQAAREAIARWRDGEVIDLEHEMKRLTLAIVARALFSCDADEVAPGMSRDIDRALDYVNRMAGRLQLPLVHALKPRDQAALRALERVDTAVRRLIHQRRAHADDSPTDFLSMLLTARTADGEALSDEEVRDETITMFVAGHETVATVLTWLFYLLAQQPTVQDRLTREADLIIGRGVLHNDVPIALPYSLQVYKEAMRLYPGGFTIGRQALREVVIGDHVIPAGAWVMISPYSVHRNADIFRDPERFDPNRFAPERERALPRGSYIPFGLGPRTCIGGQFALMEGQIIVSTFAHSIRLVNVTPGEVDISPLVTLRPNRTIEMRVVKRAHEPAGTCDAM